MININALDNIIAVVVVILLMSLIVQSIQSVLKKALKIKSRQIEDSLLDLFENVVNYNPPAPVSRESLTGKLRAWLERIFGSSPLLRKVFQIFFLRPHPCDPCQHPSDEVKQLFAEVMKGFEEIGRVAQTGKTMLDSISKEDLKKVMGKVMPDTLLTGFTTRLTVACGEIPNLEDSITKINKDCLGSLSGDANAKFAALQQELTPLINDLRSIFVGDQLSSTLVIENVLHLREIKQFDVLATLGELQKKVAEDLGAARKAPASATQAAEITGLETLSNVLGKISTSLVRVTSALDGAVAPLRTKLSEVETWYDCITQSFEERYTRGMKTWSIVIGFLLVAYLNASVFDIYKNVVTNEALRSQLLQMGEERTRANEQRLAKAKGENNQEQVEVTLKDIRNDAEEIRKQIANLNNFGFQPLSWQGVKERFNTDLWSSNGWLSRRRDDLIALAGWIVYCRICVTL